MEDENEALARNIIGNFNPDDYPSVDAIKDAAKKLIQKVGEHCPEGRRKALAITHIETAAMFAVKSLFEG